jgi:general stress protein 26
MMRNPEQTTVNLIDMPRAMFIASVDTDGFPNMKAMLPPRKREGLREFWLPINTSSQCMALCLATPKTSILFLCQTSLSPRTAYRIREVLTVRRRSNCLSAREVSR